MSDHGHAPQAPRDRVLKPSIHFLLSCCCIAMTLHVVSLESVTSSSQQIISTLNQRLIDSWHSAQLGRRKAKAHAKRNAHRGVVSAHARAYSNMPSVFPCRRTGQTLTVPNPERTLPSPDVLASREQSLPRLEPLFENPRGPLAFARKAFQGPRIKPP